MSYQHVQRFTGNMYGPAEYPKEDDFRSAGEYKGIEYDWEVPNTQIVSSPGGVSSTQHHWTKGFYGSGGSSGDIYAGSGQPYLYGNFGNMYQQGDTATYDLGMFERPPGSNDQSPIEFIDASSSPNPAFMDFDELDPPPTEVYPHEGSPLETFKTPPYGRSPKILPLKKAPRRASEDDDSLREGFTYGTPVDEEYEPPRKKRSIWIYILLFVLLYFAVDSWAKTGNLYLVEKFGLLDWKKQLVVAAILTFLLIASGILFRLPEEI